MEKLAVEGNFSFAASGSMNPEGKADRWSTEAVLTTEEGEGVTLAENERQEMEVDEVIPWTQPSSNEADGGFTMCEVQEQQAARVEVQVPKRRAVIPAESAETLDTVQERLAHEDFSQEEADEIGFVPSAFSEPRGAMHWCDNQHMQIARIVRTKVQRVG